MRHSISQLTHEALESAYKRKEEDQILAFILSQSVEVIKEMTMDITSNEPLRDPHEPVLPEGVAGVARLDTVFHLENIEGQQSIPTQKLDEQLAD
jgi:hypothetical protein